MEGGGVTMKVTEKSATNKMNFEKEKENVKKILTSEIIEQNLLKYLPTKQKPRQMNFAKYINIVLFDKFD